MTGPITTRTVLAVLEGVQEELIKLLPELPQPQRDIVLRQLTQTAGMILSLRRRVTRSEYEKARRGSATAGLVTAPRSPSE